MHARNELQSTINEPNHDLALQINMNHARMNSRTATRRWMSYLSLVELGVRELKYANTLQLPSNSSSFQGIQGEFTLTPYLPLSSRWCAQNELMKCVCVSIMRIKDDPSSGPLKWQNGN